MTTPIRQSTTVQYQGLDVTIIGELDAGLLAIAGYDTPQEFAIAAIRVTHRCGRYVYCVAGDYRWLGSLEATAKAAANDRATRDAS